MKKAGALSGLLGLAATGAAAGLAAERYAIGRARLRPDPDAREPFFELPAGHTHTVLADDGVVLHVEQVGAGELTVVFCHGYTQQSATWHYQRLALGEDAVGTIVLWDQRSHGRSGRSAPERATIDQLGADLHAVLSATAPHGPIVLVGHSMGGMSVLALAQAHPELFGDRVVGVALIATSAGRLAQLSFGLPASATGLTRRALPFLTRGMSRRPGAFERGRSLGTDLAYVVTRRVAFGSGEVSPTLVEFVERMTAQTPADVIAHFYDTFINHDKLAALPVLRNVETLVLCGTEDKVTPVAHSRAMAAELPEAQLVVVEGAGHMVHLERPSLVTLHLRALLTRAQQRA